MYSSMARARETAQIISECLPNIVMESTDLIREGAPIPPEPPTPNWRPGAQARNVPSTFRVPFGRCLTMFVFSSTLKTELG